MQHLANLRPPLGATYMGEDRYHFYLWAPNVENVKLRLLDPDERLFPELSATVHFLPEEKEGDSADKGLEKAVFAPVAAIQDAGDSKYVWVFSEDRVRKATVTTHGEPNGQLIQVTGDLVGGEALVISPPAELKEGDEVKTAE